MKKQKAIQTLVKRDSCGCELHEWDGRAWTIYCRTHRPWKRTASTPSGTERS